MISVRDKCGCTVRYKGAFSVRDKDEFSLRVKDEFRDKGVCVLCARACKYLYILLSSPTGTGQKQARKTMANGREDDDYEEDDSQRGRR